MLDWEAAKGNLRYMVDADRDDAPAPIASETLPPVSGTQSVDDFDDRPTPLAKAS
jgi:hypothetical protein